MKKRILLVEDEKHLAETIKLNLEIEDNTDAKKCVAEFEELLKAS